MWIPDLITGTVVRNRERRVYQMVYSNGKPLTDDLERYSELGYVSMAGRGAIPDGG